MTQPVLFEWNDDQPRMQPLRDTGLRNAAAMRMAQSDRGVVVLAAFSKVDGRFGNIEKASMKDIARLFDGVDAR